MLKSNEVNTILTIKLKMKPGMQLAFADWQAKLNAVITTFTGFISLEILSPTDSVESIWLIILRFNTSESLSAWRNSKDCKELKKELSHFLASDRGNQIEEIESGTSDLRGGVTEVFVTQVSRDKEDAYREWIAKIHRAEAKFPGFRGVYVQSPSQNQGLNWITLLQFDTPENLDRWLASQERQDVLNESKPLITSLESHRVISPYAGWFASLESEGVTFPVWKQTMLILLVLFPIVMLEFKFLSPRTQGLNISLATFIGNAISVSLVSWPMMPISIWFLGWWLSPKGSKIKHATFIGTIVVLLLYLLEVISFWNLKL